MTHILLVIIIFLVSLLSYSLSQIHELKKQNKDNEDFLKILTKQFDIIKEYELTIKNANKTFTMMINKYFEKQNNDIFDGFN